MKTITEVYERVQGVDIVPLVHSWLTEALKGMHNMTFTMSMMDVFAYLVICAFTVKLVDDRYSIIFVQAIMLFVVFAT